ncbi:hypothetical protein [Arthrobacter sp. ISL-28]|uniref:hypothetical protein n=1 Tax=Arthrobacter sp. ISL-28 TaxID=2819108 RepID=UPI001BE64AB4|nr:hypothetical protein [Arthrobacter sp. ISL-28]MBT2522080.1 hypothetical protein [Arthrobacter sp. ISL-28]
MLKRVVTGAAATAFAATLALATPATAAVTFDPATGTGFVGKGDVQTALVWNNQQLQKNASAISFSYESEDLYSARCEWVTGEGTKGEQLHQVTYKRHTSVQSTVAYDPRVRNQITGFNLTGFGTTTTSGTVPVVGEACQGDGREGTWTAVELTSSSGGGLYVNHLSTTVRIY